MTTENTETTETAADVAAQGADVAPEKASPKKGASAKKAAPKGQKSAKGAKPKAAAPKKATSAKRGAKAPKQTTKAKESAGPREGSKTAQVVAMLQRKSGATLRARHPRRAGPIAAGSSIDPFRCSPGSCTECRTGRASQRGSRRLPGVARSPSSGPSGRRQVSRSHWR